MADSVKYDFDEALAIFNKKTGQVKTDKKLLERLNADNVEIHCRVKNVPLVIEETDIREGENGIEDRIEHRSIWCYTGYFNVSSSDGGDGREYLEALSISGEESDIREEDESKKILERGVTLLDGLDGLNGGRLDGLVADMDMSGYTDSPLERILLEECQFQHVPVGQYRPKLRQLYIERVRFDWWLKKYLKEQSDAPESIPEPENNLVKPNDSKKKSKRDKQKEETKKKKYNLSNPQRNVVMGIIDGLKAMTGNYGQEHDHSDLLGQMETLIIEKYGYKPTQQQVLEDLAFEKVEITRQTFSKYFKMAFTKV